MNNDYEESESENSSYDDTDIDTHLLINRDEVDWTNPVTKLEYKFERILSFGDQLMVNKDVSIRLKHKNESIGCLIGLLLPRPHDEFFSLADSEIRDELGDMVRIFCTSNGEASRIDTGLEGEDRRVGGLIFIESMMVEPSHKGHDIGLRMVHELLVFLYGQWNIVILDPAPFKHRVKDRLDRRQGLDLDSNEGDILFRELTIKLFRHYARMGFQQASKNMDDYHAWYMTAKTYFMKDDNGDEIDHSSLIQRWKTKDEIQRLDIYLPPKLMSPEGIDKELQGLIKSAIKEKKFQDRRYEITELVQSEGACLNKSKALFLFSRYYHSSGEEMLHEHSSGKEMLRILISLGANINITDERGMSPLHYAVDSLNIDAVKSLVDAGADISLRNIRGHTPLMRFERILECEIHRDRNTCSPYACMSYIMPNELRELLIDDWLSPRVFMMLKITAETTLSDWIGPHIWVQFEQDGPTPIRRFISSMRFQFEYIPLWVLDENLGGFYKKFIDGWGVVWIAIRNAIMKRKAPTLSRIYKEIQVLDEEAISSYNYFVEREGSIEFALDALVKITERVDRIGEADWVYEHYQSEIESLPATFLDSRFDLVRKSLLEINADNEQEKPSGPYDQSSYT